MKVFRIKLLRFQSQSSCKRNKKLISMKFLNELCFSAKHLLLAFIFVFSTFSSFAFLTDLRSQGYSLIPAPQETTLTGKNISVDKSWKVQTDISNNSIALKRLHEGANDLLALKFEGTGSGKIILEIVPGSISGNFNAIQTKEAYRIQIEANTVKISSNAEAGLFYGVQSLLQLLKPTPRSDFNLPEGTITDWPDLELRMIHWDTKHHQSRLETLKNYIDWSAFFKVNAIAFEIEDKYEYPRNPIIGAPGAFTTAEMHELTEYAMERNIQLVPNVQAPAHMTFVLKHEQFAHLRSDGSNYQACMCDEEAMELIFDMYQDMIDATPGVEYFFVSTDEVYYAGICEKCEDEYNDENRSQCWVDYLNRVHQWMEEKGRKVIAWVEYPLLTEHIKQLPEGLIDGIMVPNSSKEWVAEQNKTGVKQLAYSSMQGSEYLFPNFFENRYRNRLNSGRLYDASVNIDLVRANGAKPIGTFAAAWDDSGLHSETFWLGWATVTQYAWTNNKPSLEQNVADFMNTYYGYDSPYMVDIYQSLQDGARFYEDLWERRPSTERDMSYGSSYGPTPYRLSDIYLEMPNLPSVSDLSVNTNFRDKNKEKIEGATKLKPIIEELIHKLIYATNHVSRNRYNLEVYLSIASLEKYTINTVLDLAKIENYMELASDESKNSKERIAYLVEAYHLVEQIITNQREMWNSLEEVWEKSRFEKCRSVGGRDFVHIFDDVKDHFADRRLGLEYMLAPFERMEIGKWQNQLWDVINEYAQANDVQIEGFEVKRLED
ncbi:hypothetical protein D1164_07615 [Mariniphaga sediminis]|uniref:beta-N-acetylhexosaminidase n=3 Tax=Mariniphaga sediminis TaxID=1628158 RepID=A0A399D3B3_9BACT|nr:hypothetical protein D1164_07615 [Mariniphaga sediminis]